MSYQTCLIIRTSFFFLNIKYNLDATQADGIISRRESNISSDRETDMVLNI